MRSQIVIITALAVSLLNGVHAFAQSKQPPAPNPSRTPGPPIDASMPIDDNLILLVIAGLFLGAYFIYKRNIIKKKAL